MALDLTEKQVDILVNGNLQQSYAQRANSANYDISANRLNSFQTTNEYDNTITKNPFSRDKEVQVHTISQGGWYHIFGTLVDPQQTATVDVRINGQQVFRIQGNETKNTMSTLNSGDTVEYVVFDGQFDSINIDIERVTNSTFISGPLGNQQFRVPSGVSIDSVSKS